MTHTAPRRLPLEGVRVVELGQLLAGPFTGTLLAYFGADVVKVEPPGGDPIRGWRKLDDDGTSFWWRSLGRNKKSVTLDLKTDQGKALVRKMMTKADVVIENFRPGTMENWGLGPDSFSEDNPGLVYTRISGYGQTGPYASKPGYASVCEGIGGMRYVNGFPGERPVPQSVAGRYHCRLARRTRHPAGPVRTSGQRHGSGRGCGPVRISVQPPGRGDPGIRRRRRDS